MSDAFNRLIRSIEDEVWVSNAELVGEFHRAFEVDEPSVPTEATPETALLRFNLIREEYLEVTDELLPLIAGSQVDLAALAKELADLLVVVYGTARAFGIPIDAVFAEVHRSNMSKLGRDGKPIRREDGKILKGPSYTPADVAEVLRAAQK